MTKRVVVRVAARGYVDGRYIGEEKEVIEAIDPSGRGKRKRGKAVGKRGATVDNRGNRIAGKGARGGGAGGNRRGTAADGRGNRPRSEAGQSRDPRGGRGTPRTATSGLPAGILDGNTIGPLVSGAPAGGRGRDRNARGRGKPRGAAGGPPDLLGSGAGMLNVAGDGRPPRARKSRGGKKTPFRAPQGGNQGQNLQGSRALISEVAQTRRWRDESKSGQFAEALSKESNVKRERLHKVLAQSGHGSRRDMEIMIASGRVMVNGIVATTGMTVSPADAVMVDHHLVKLKFSEELPRVLLYHKPEGEIVTTDDPGNRITVFDNLPPVENGKWMSVGRLDINTSGLLIFTTSGELANRLMHPRYEVEREYAVRVLGELTEEQTAQLLSGVSIAVEPDDLDGDEDEIMDDRPAKFDSIEKRGGEGVNQWYHVVLSEGRNREVRKMFEAVGLTVSRLIRVRFGKIGLPPRLTRGRMMELDPSQARAVLRWVGMEVEGPIGQLPSNGPARTVHVSRRDGEGGNEVPLDPDAQLGAAVEVPADESGREPIADGRGRRARGRRARGSRDPALVRSSLPQTLDAQMMDSQPADTGVASPSSADSLPLPPREGRRGRGRKMRRLGRERGLMQQGGGGVAYNADDQDNIGNALPSVPRQPVHVDIDDSIGNRIVPVQPEAIHRSANLRAELPGQRQGEPRGGGRRRSRRRKGNPGGGPRGGRSGGGGGQSSGGGPGNTL
ncbi:MAG: pseudouridine synthase [Burkholderiales bacterium]|jgi:23S rRNA pseudouridine2605 synthase